VATELTEITKVQELVYELKIEQVMTRPVITVSPQTRLHEIKEIMRLNRISGVPVVDRGVLVGIISIEDLIKALERGEVSATVAEKMTCNVITVSCRDSVIEAVQLFRQHAVGRLPVVDARGSLVGILTSGDITRGLLQAIGLDYQAEEIRKYRASHIFEDIVSDQTSLILCYKVAAQDFAHGGEASSKIKKALYRLGANPPIIRRVAIATYEAEMNLIIHAEKGGDVIGEIQPDKIRIVAIDSGPGIPDIEQAMQPGYSTAPDWIRELGFGAGMGLVNIKRCADQLTLRSVPGVGTRLEVSFFISVGRFVGQPRESGEACAVTDAV
jgi:CBS domain-containing protein/anti-sigma regulatory factor (Ser/Thr protein kinase)